jgi:hypothetical protein
MPVKNRARKIARNRRVVVRMSDNQQDVGLVAVIGKGLGQGA